MLYKDNAFVGLSYEDKNLVHTSTGLPTLHRDHMRLFLNRLRTSIAPHKIRTYYVGEYGDETERPHYHAILFNFPTCLRNRTLRRVESGSRPIWAECCPQCQLVGAKWGLGDVDLGTVGPESAGYICGYTTKKMTAPDDIRLNGRAPEFAQPSLKPGLGQGMMHEYASAYLGLDPLHTQGDVPSSLRHGARELPLGRYLRRELRSLVGLPKDAPPEAMEELAARLSPMWETAWASKTANFKEEIIKEGKQKRLNQASKQRINRKVRTL